jgi:hypothetical protein
VSHYPIEGRDTASEFDHLLQSEMVHCTGPDWAVYRGSTPLMAQVCSIMMSYNQNLSNFFASIRAAPAYIRNHFNIGHLDQEGRELVDQAEVVHMSSKAEWAELANSIAVYLCNSDAIHALVIRYYRQKMDIFTTEIQAVGNAMKALPPADCVLYTQMIGHLAVKVSKKSNRLGETLMIRAPVVKKTFPVPKDSSEESDSSEVDDESGSEEKKAPEVPAVPERDKSPVRK